MTTSNWSKIRVLGKGAYGTIYLARSTEDHPFIPLAAVKSAKLQFSASLIKEDVILSALADSPGVVACFGSEIVATGEDEDRTFNLLLEYAPGGTLTDVRHRNGGRLSETQIRVATGMILKGLRAVHARDLVHCDLKPDNILAFPADSSTGGSFPCLKIADFGLAKFPNCDDDDHEIFAFSKFRGTPAYMSPESVGERIVGPALDIWSLGCIVVEMFTGECAIKSNDLDTLALQLGFLRQAPEIPAGMSVFGRDFLSKCLATDASVRWTAEQLLKHSFVAAGEPCASKRRVCCPVRSMPSPLLSTQLLRSCL